MVKYFKELLHTLKMIEIHLKEISRATDKNPKGYGNVINIKHWNM